MATETLNLPDPASPNVNDGSQDYDLAVGWSTAVPGVVSGVEWFPPLSAPGVTPVAKLWRVSDEALLASKSFTSTPGVRQNIAFDTPVAVDPGDYRCSVYTIFFTLTAAWGGWPATSDNLLTDNPDGWLSVGAGFPDDGPRTALYHVSPIFEASTDEDPAEGAAALGLNLAVAAAGGRDSKGAGAVGLQLALAAAGVRPSRGSAAFTLNLAVAAVGPVANAVPARRLNATAPTAGLASTAPTSRLTAV